LGPIVVKDLRSHGCLFAPGANERRVGHAPERVRARDPRDRLEQAGLALPVGAVDDREPGIELEVEAAEAPEVVDPEASDPCDRTARGLGEHVLQDVRTGISRYRKFPFSAACSVAGCSGATASSTTSSVSTAATPS